MTPAETLKARRAARFTTIARCWQVVRRDGVSLGFTDHDRPLAFGGQAFEPGAALEGTDATASLGLAADDIEVAGALTSDAITESDLRRGLYDGAAVTVWDADWSDPEGAHLVVGRYTLGEVERRENRFVAEVRSRTAGLSRKVGRQVVATCDAELGDGRCGVDVSGPPFMLAASVTDTDGPLGVLSDDAGLDGKATGYFDRGRLEWTSGPNAGLVSTVRRHSGGAGLTRLDLWRAPPFPVEAGHAFEVRAGCDKTFGTCVLKFENGPNFRGCPHVPSEYYPVTYGRRDAPGQDGGSSNPPPTVPDPVYEVANDDDGVGA